MPETTAGTESRLKNNDLLADDIGTLGFGRSFSIVGCNDDGDWLGSFDVLFSTIGGAVCSVIDSVGTFDWI